MAKLKSRRLIAKSGTSDEEEKTLIYCRRCQGSYVVRDFHSALDKELDRNGFLSVCKNCINEIYENELLASGGNMEEAIYKVCKMLNILFSSKVVESLKLHLAKQETQGVTKQVFGLYKSHLGRHLSLNEGLSGTFIDNPIIFSPEDTIEGLINETEDFKKYLSNFWGNGLSEEDYSYLESELARWKKTHSCSNAAEETLLREVCFTNFEIRKARLVKGGDPSALIKRLQELMKTANLASPVAASQNAETFGLWVKDIEATTPAEWWEDNKIFQDVDGLRKYIEDYIIRPIRNFIMSTRDFKISENEDTELDDDEALDGIDIQDGTEPEVENGIS